MKKIVIIICIIFITALGYLTYQNNKFENIMVSIDGENDNWIVEGSIEGRYRFIENKDHQLEVESTSSKDIRLTYKNDLKDLNKVSEVKIELFSEQSGLGSDLGFNENVFRFKSSFNISRLMRLKKQKTMEIIITWKDDIDHKDVILLNVK